MILKINMKKIEVVAGVIYHNDNFLISKRKHKFFNGLWEFPGGKIEKNESHIEALIREIKEELNIKINVENFITTINYQYPDFYLVMHVYKCKYLSGKIDLNVHSEIRWITKNDIDEIEWVPADIEIIKKI